MIKYYKYFFFSSIDIIEENEIFLTWSYVKYHLLQLLVYTIFVYILSYKLVIFYYVKFIWIISMNKLLHK